MIKKIERILPCFTLVILILCSCVGRGGQYESGSAESDSDTIAALTQTQQDSLSFVNKHHFYIGYNFLVKTDTMTIVPQEPEELLAGFIVDTLQLLDGQRIVVSGSRIISYDTADSVWIKILTDDGRQGWIHEKTMLDNVVPDDPISMFIDFFSDVHLLAFILFIILILSAYIIIHFYRNRIPMVHFNDIDTFYPTMFCLTVAASATFYASIQLFAVETWRDYYFNPTLNPFTEVPLLSIFIASFWAIIILGIAAVDDVRRHLPTLDAIFYILGMGAICALNYIVFSITTLYYIGYPLFVIYVIFAVYRFVRHSYTPYLCGKCGKQLRRKGRCPYCGTMNE